MPGGIVNIGTDPGSNSVNSARLHPGREQVDQHALVALSTDSAVPEDVLQKLRNLPQVIAVKSLKM